MSISREIWRRASPSNKRLFLRAKRTVPLALGGAAFVAFLFTFPWVEAWGNMQMRRSERAQLEPLRAEAARDALTFPQIVASHPAHLHKLVVWEVTVQSSTSSYAEGRVSWPIIWSNPDRVSQDLLWHPTTVVARVEGVRDDVVILEYLGKP